jgi:hypothetical protein
MRTACSQAHLHAVVDGVSWVRRHHAGQRCCLNNDVRVVLASHLGRPVAAATQTARRYTQGAGPVLPQQSVVLTRAACGLPRGMQLVWLAGAQDKSVMHGAKAVAPHSTRNLGQTVRVPPPVHGVDLPLLLLLILKWHVGSAVDISRLQNSTTGEAQQSTPQSDSLVIGARTATWACRPQTACMHACMHAAGPAWPRFDPHYVCQPCDCSTTPDGH